MNVAAHDPAAARAGVPVGGVRRVELVAAPDEPHPAVPRLRLELVEQREVEVPRHREHVARPDLRQPPREVPPQRGLPRRGRSCGRRRGRRRVGGRRLRADRGGHGGGGGGGGGSEGRSGEVSLGEKLVRCFFFPLFFSRRVGQLEASGWQRLQFIRWIFDSFFLFLRGKNVSDLFLNF